MGDGAFEFVNCDKPAQTGSRHYGDDCTDSFQFFAQVAQIVRTDHASR